MKNKTIDLHNRTFIIDKISLDKNINYSSIYELYTTPSCYKIRAFKDWQLYFYNNYDVISFGIVGGNCNTFSISCTATDKDNDATYKFYITRDYNRVYRVD